jgi:hypothetical protein
MRFEIWEEVLMQNVKVLSKHLPEGLANKTINQNMHSLQ